MSDPGAHDSDEGASVAEGSRPRAQSGGQTTSPERPSRARTLMTPAQLAGLQGLWAESRFPSTRQRDVLGASIGLTSRKVQVWFQNQRSKHRRMEAERQDPSTPAFAERSSYSSPMFGPPYDTRNAYDLSQAGQSTSASAPRAYQHYPSQPGGPSEAGRHLHQSGPPSSRPSYLSGQPLGSSRPSEPILSQPRDHFDRWARGRHDSEESSGAWSDDHARRVAGQGSIATGTGTAPRPPTLSSSGGSRRQGERTESYMMDETRASVSERPRSSRVGPQTPPEGSPGSSRHPSPSSNSSSTGLQRERSDQISLPSFREFILASTDELSPARSGSYPSYSTSAGPTYAFGPSSQPSSTSPASLKRKHLDQDATRPWSSAMSRTSPPSAHPGGLLLPPAPTFASGSPSSTISADQPQTRPLSASYLPPRPLSSSHPPPPQTFMARAQSHGGGLETSGAPSLVSSHSYSTLHTTTGPSSPLDETGSEPRAVRARGESVGEKREGRGPFSWGLMMND